MPYIELKNIKKVFPDGENGRRTVLNNLSLSLEQGDFVAITGKSGSGKTTLLNILGTLLLPDEGSYTLAGTDVTAPGIALNEIRNRHIGFVFQDHRLLPQFTAKENILIPLLATKNRVEKEEEQFADELMERMGIANIARQLPGTLSGGEKARTALCRALIQRPELILADEPTGQLDADTSQQIMQLFKEINEQMGKTIVMVTHSAEMAATAHRIYNLT